jgi:NAD-dependent deacetylase
VYKRQGHNIEDVATPRAYQRNPQLVLDFYNMRRKDVAAAEPNAAHFGLAKLEEKYHVTIVTQNIDDLHERAGSKNIIHLHGEIFKMRSDKNENLITEIRGDINVGDKASDGAQLRPHIVWFEEPVPMIEDAALVMSIADIFILIGTSLQVYPAAGLLHYLPEDAVKYVIDKKIPEVHAVKNLVTIEESATTGIAKLLDYLL